MRDRTKYYFIFWMMILGICNLQYLTAQNLNKPNKIGPLGIEVNTFTGNVFISRTDAFALSRGLDLNIDFFYNSFDFEKNVGFGKGWSMVYNVSYQIDSSNNVSIVWGDAREDIFISNGVGYISPNGIYLTLTQYQPNKYLVRNKNGVKFYFDNSTLKKITKIEDPGNNNITFLYTDSLLTNISNSDGQSISLAYNSNGNLQSLTDAITSPVRITNYHYDGNGNLLQVTDPLGSKMKYTYLVNGPMKTMTDKNKNTVDIIYYGDVTCSELIGCNKRISFSYDTTTYETTCTDYLETGNNQITKYKYQKFEDLVWLTNLSSNCCGFEMNFEYDQHGNKISETDANGNVTTFTYDANGNPLSVTDALGNSVHYSYSSDFNKITSFTNEKGQITNLSYDAQGNIIQLTLPGNNSYFATYAANGDILTSTDPKGIVYTYTHDAYGNLTSVSGPYNFQASMRYNERGDLVSITDSRGNKDSLEYDILSRLKTITDPLSHSVTYAYDSSGNLISSLNEKNQLSTIQYDASNRPVITKDAMGNKTIYAFDAMDNLISKKDALGNITTYEFDNRNRLSAVVNALGDIFSFNYDPNGNVIAINFPSGAKMNYSYDAKNRLTAVSDSLGTLRTYGYDAVGNVISISDGAGNSAFYLYDNNNRVSKYTDRFGKEMNFGYDLNDNITTITDRNNHTRTLTYDSLNRIVAFSDNMGYQLSAVYDNNGNVISLVDQNNHSTLYTYDSLNRLKRTTYPDGKFFEYSYDNLGNVVNKKLTDGTNIIYAYDSLNRIISKLLPNGNVFSYTYDSLSRIRTATNSSGTIYFEYDALGRLIKETSGGKTVAFGYDVSGRTQTILYPDSTAVTYVYDTRNRLTSIAKNNILLVSFQYDAKNNMTQKSFSNGVVTTMQYDAANRLIAYSSGANGSIQNTTLTYDNENNTSSLTQLNDQTKSEQYVYDNNYRLIDYKKGPVGSPVVHNTYSYDAVGNRVAANLNGTSVIYTVNNLNQITNSSGSVPVNYVYDDNGNLIFDGVYYKSYDAEGRILKDSSSPANVITYVYDALNRRVQRNLNAGLSKITYAGALPIEQRDGSDVLKRKNYFMGFLSPVVTEKEGENYFYHDNQLNSIVAISNAQGKAIEKYEYDVFGKTTILDSNNITLNSSQVENQFGYTGQSFDTATGTVNFFYREYNPETGLFNQRDLIGYADGMGLYQYVHNNPASGVDIWGLDDCPPKNNNTTNIGNDNEFFDHAGNWLTLLSQFEKLAESNKFKGTKMLVDINNLKVKIDRYRNPNNGLSAKDQQVLVADIEVAIAGIAADLTPKTPYTAGPKLAMDIYGKADALTQELTGGNSIAYHYAHMSDASEHLGSVAARRNEERFQRLNQFVTVAYKTQGKDVSQWTKEAKEQYDILKRVIKFRQENTIPNPKKAADCPQNTNNRGKQKPTEYYYNPQTDELEILQAPDPNAMIGPDGEPDKHWVSVHDRQPYTILFENSKDATAPAKYIRIVSPVEPKQDAASFQLGSFGFNNQTFTIPPNTSGYYQRLDCRDSLGLYVDITAGYDVVQNRFFWEFQSIDPVTLLPTANPLKGFLLQQDSSKGNHGHAFVNFSTKPVQSAVTLDTISTIAKIVFDGNDTIPTNRHKNTIDAFAPTTHFNNLPPTSMNVVNLSWSGADDVNGCGIKFYTLYVSTDGTNFNILKSGITRTDTTFYGANATMYYFFVLGTDSVGNTETLRPGEIKSTFLSSVLPVTWLYFKGKNLGKDNLLEWATANEQNTNKFILERSADGNSFATIGSRNAAGNSSVTTYYDYTDRNVDRLRQDILYYRLKQTDINGAYKYSNIVRLRVNSQGKENSIVYPNPTRGQITIALGDKSLLGTEAILFDANGRLLKRFKIEAETQMIDISQYVNGIYFIRLSDKEVLKIVKQ